MLEGLISKSRPLQPEIHSSNAPSSKDRTASITPANGLKRGLPHVRAVRRDAALWHHYLMAFPAARRTSTRRGETEPAAGASGGITFAMCRGHFSPSAPSWRVGDMTLVDPEHAACYS